VVEVEDAGSVGGDKELTRLAIAVHQGDLGLPLCQHIIPVGQSACQPGQRLPSHRVDGYRLGRPLHETPELGGDGALAVGGEAGRVQGGERRGAADDALPGA
jgi:hypothetical protein